MTPLILLKLLYFMLPAYIANMAPLLGRRIWKSWNTPIDFGKRWRGKPIFGSHKTHKGLLFGTLAGIIVAYIQSSWATSLHLVDYSQWFILGALLGFGAVAGDAVKSFFKRQAGIAPGKPWIPWDQLDFTIGALVFVAPVYFPGWEGVVWLLIASFVLHVLSRFIGYYLGLLKVKW